MNFTNARTIEQVVWNMRLADYQRGLNRARINDLANGAPPYQEDEARRNNIEINVNDLSLTRLSHDARLQLYQGFNKPGNFFTARTDMGAQDRRNERGVIVTNAINRILKKSDTYYECSRSQFALQVLHGIGPALWEDCDYWCPEPVGIEDVLMPANTRLTFKNLPFFAVWRGYTAEELRRLTRGRNPDPGWKMDVVERACKWADEQTSKLYGGTRWSEYWSPEKWVERMKMDSGVYASDLVQTIDCFDFYFWDDRKGKQGWRRRIVFDAYGGSGSWLGNYGPSKQMPGKNLIGDEEGLFLYNSGDRVWGDHINELIHFQFADLSSVAPFRYHSVRSLGFLLYAACHLQNRLRCKFSEAVFENLMMYMRVNSLDEAERTLKIQLASRGIIDESVHFLSPVERWQPNAQMIELGLQEYKQVIADNSSSYLQNNNFARDRVEKTKFQVMAEVNAMQTLVSAALQQAYRYENIKYREIFRRFMKSGSRDPDVRDFRASVLKKGVPERMLTADAWEIEPERVIGGGNKTLEMAVAQQLWEMRAAYPIESQNKILRDITLAVTDDASRANDLVPFEPAVSNSRHDVMISFGSLMVGGKVGYRNDQNRIDIIEVLIAELTLAIQRVMQTGGMATKSEVMGFQNVLSVVSENIAQLTADKAQQERAKDYANSSGQLANQVKAFAQRLAEQNGNGENGSDAETTAKIRASQMLAQAKAENMRESHGQRTAQKQVQFEQMQQQQQASHALELERQMQTSAVDLEAQKAKAKLDVAITAANEKARQLAKPKTESE